MAKPAITISMLALLVAALLAQSTPGSARALLQDCKATMEVSTVEALTTAVGCANTGATTEIDIINDLSAPDLKVYELSSSVEVRGGQVPGQWGQNGIDINISGENVFSGGGVSGGAKLTNIAFVFDGTGESAPSFSLAAITFNPMDDQTVVLGIGSGNLKISATSFDTITNATAVVVLDSMSLITSSNVSFNDCASPDAGGAMRFNSSGSFKLSSTSFTNVSSDAQGGALWLSTGDNAAGGGFPIGPLGSKISSTSFDSCTGTDGGAMYVAAGIISLAATGFRNCNAANDASSGGGMYLANGAAIKAFSATGFESCTAAGAGGGMYVAGTVPISISVSFDGNSAAEGNNLAVSSEGTVTFTPPFACLNICESDTDCTGVTCPSNPFGH
uniref:Uncharacterized protein n=1 Tax=Prasinoderma singulare TaxID=676789 RepID=A0A7S3BD34_9VIRI|mmetsp:Transcript_13567/g.42654  ORF Transcript_13567/g.42654 Transcript_13567/m.42654 type:complete len:389 (+) Transcript_13567:161-1327(+)